MRRRGRKIDGILLLDKPPGATSNGALQHAKRLFSAAKAGHTGSLDPLATGVLPLCFGEATKFSQFLLEANKRYLAEVTLGVLTDTGDADGKVTGGSPPGVYTDERIESVLEMFRGEIDQVPSMFSALKVNGEPLYKLARQGIEVERKSRKVTIFELDLVERRDKLLVLEIHCSKGTYIRSLAEDIGNELGCGGHVSALKRLQSGPFQLEETYTLDQLSRVRDESGLHGLNDCLLPISAAVQDWPSVEIAEITASYLKQGQAVQIPHPPTNGWVRIFSDGAFLGVGEVIDDGRITPRRLISGR